MPEVQAAIAAAGSLAYSLERARDHARAAERALDGLAPNAALAALRGLARYAVDRDR
jgi:octaprenyl-diphosphate synthase